MKTRIIWPGLISLVFTWLMACSEAPAEQDEASQELAGQAEIRLPFYNKADFTPEWVEESSPAYDSIHTIGTFAFTNQNGEPVTDQTLSGKIYVANFFFTICPSICPKMTTNLEEVYTAYKGDKEVSFLSHTVMPWVDSVQVLHRYAERLGLNTDQWHFVTGSKEAIYDLARGAYFAEEEIGLDKSTDEFLHTENFILVDKKGRIRGVYNGTIELEMRRLKEDITALKKLG